MGFFVLGQQCRHKSVNAVNDSVKVNAKSETPVVDLMFPQPTMSARGNTGVIADDMNLAEFGESRVAKSFN